MHSSVLTEHVHVHALVFQSVVRALLYVAPSACYSAQRRVLIMDERAIRLANDVVGGDYVSKALDAMGQKHGKLEGVCQIYFGGPTGAH